jgi:hypothetical protein
MKLFICIILLALLVSCTPMPTQDINALSDQIAKTIVAGAMQTEQAKLPPTPESTKIPQPTPAPTQDMRLGLSLPELYNYYTSLTHLQRSDLMTNLDGKTVDWTGVVYDVGSDGIIVIAPPTGNCAVTLSGIPLEVVKTINKGTSIRFTGAILEPRGDDYPGLCILLVNVQIIK